MKTPIRDAINGETIFYLRYVKVYITWTLKVHFTWYLKPCGLPYLNNKAMAQMFEYFSNLRHLSYELCLCILKLIKSLSPSITTGTVNMFFLINKYLDEYYISFLIKILFRMVPHLMEQLKPYTKTKLAWSLTLFLLLFFYFCLCKLEPCWSLL